MQISSPNALSAFAVKEGKQQELAVVQVEEVQEEEVQVVAGKAVEADFNEAAEVAEVPALRDLATPATSSAIPSDAKL
jgi:hypothetical protein